MLDLLILNGLIIDGAGNPGYDGAIWPSDRPGLGIELVHDAVAEFAIEPGDPKADWKTTE